MHQIRLEKLEVDRLCAVLCKKLLLHFHMRGSVYPPSGLQPWKQFLPEKNENLWLTTVLPIEVF